MQKVGANSFRVRFEQSEKHKDYIFWLHKKLKNLGKTSLKPVTKRIRPGNIVMYYFYTYSYSNLIYLYNDFYTNNIKRLPFNLMEFEELFTPLA